MYYKVRSKLKITVDELDPSLYFEKVVTVLSSNGVITVAQGKQLIGKATAFINFAKEEWLLTGTLSYIQKVGYYFVFW
jgi:hypothetical protein